MLSLGHRACRGVKATPCEGAGHEHAQGCIGPRAVHGIVRNSSTGSVRHVIGDAPALFTERKTKAIGPFPRL